ncbi:hypothetical protein G6F40_016462 [Rhizopus arrhizus]|nr:hypothetical protein G6F40_016462 [Rhizopus arrhizus]
MIWPCSTRMPSSIITSRTLPPLASSTELLALPCWMATAGAVSTSTAGVRPNRKAMAAAISSTPTITSRMVRPREMRATKRPTNGAQAIHHAP